MLETTWSEGPLDPGWKVGDHPVRGVFLVRVAGLPASALAAFSTGSTGACTRELAAGRRLRGELEAARAELVAVLHGLVAPAPPALRRLLLAAKRDAFGGREIGRHRTAARWPEMAELAGRPLARVLAAEAELAACEVRFEASYQAQLERERAALRQAFGAPRMRRGLALASPVLAEVLEAEDGTAGGRRERKLESSLLRYLSRTVCKLSPFSTFTRCGLGGLVGDGRKGFSAPGSPALAHGPPLQLSGGAWRETPLLRLRRYLLEQDLALLERNPAFRAGLRARLNDTLEAAGGGRFRFVRPERWVPAEDGKRLRLQPSSLVQLELGPPLAEALSAIGAAGDLPLAELRAALETGLGDRQTAAGLVWRLCDLGLLNWRHPWPDNTPHLEKRLLELLRALPEGPPQRDQCDRGDRADRIGEITACLARIVELEETWGRDAAFPAGSLAEIDRLLDRLWQAELAAAREPPLPPTLLRHRAKERDLREDVFLGNAGGERGRPPGARRSRADSPLGTGEEAERDGEICSFSAATAAEVLTHVAPWVRLVALQDRRFECLHALAARARELWPGRERVGALELFAACQPLWRDYRKLVLLQGAEGGAAPAGPFNPLRLPRVEALAALRQELSRELRSLLAGPGDHHLGSGELAPLVARIPPAYAPAVGPCLFLQAADAGQGTWVLNRIFEGTGRYGSRFTAAMPEPARDLYAAAMGRGGARTANRAPEGSSRGEAELVDLQWSRADTLNVHEVLTPRAIELPGECLDLPPARLLRLHDLSVRLDGDPERLPELVDDTGRHLLPTHLGGGAIRFLPPLAQFLALWGPGEWRPFRAPVAERRQGEIAVRGRVTLGNVVVARRRWSCPPPQGLSRAGSAARAFAALHAWRVSLGLPERVFWIEPVRGPVAAGAGAETAEVFKPQYLDFTSPLFVSLFLAACAPRSVTPPEPLIFEEVLPQFEAYPADGASNRWAVELQLDTLALPPSVLDSSSGAGVATSSSSASSAVPEATRPEPASGGLTHQPGRPSTAGPIRSGGSHGEQGERGTAVQGQGSAREARRGAG